jgi:hypothetical protein
MLVGGLALARAVAPVRATVEFYSAASQIIPVLLVVLALERRLFRVRFVAAVRRQRDESWSSYVEAKLRGTVSMLVAGITLVVLIGGELQALNALANTHPEHANPQNVYTAVAVGFVIVAFIALFGAPQDDRASDGE